MSIFARMLGYDPETHLKAARHHFREKRWGEALIEYEKARHLLPDSEREKKGEIDFKIRECKHNLATIHIEWGDNLQASKEWGQAAEEYELALSLMSQDDERIRSVTNKRDYCKMRYYQSLEDDYAQEFVERGDEFMKNEEYAQALVEYREALKFLKYHVDDSDNLKKRVLENLEKAEEKLAEPYIERAVNLMDAGLYEEALSELESARELVDAENRVSTRIDRLILEARRKQGVQEPPLAEEVAISKSEWDEAMEDYHKTLENYFAFSFEERDPYKVSGVNIYEREFERAKRRVGELYLKRADGHMNLGKVKTALKYYMEARNFFRENDPEQKYLSEQIDRCCTQIVEEK